MSFGFVTPPGGGPAIMRGPMVTQVINQLLTGTEWGELDYLVLDLPPGTGDIQLTLTQMIPLTAAVIVTTPQELSFVDVVKGIQMFDKLKVPTVAAVENMSYFVCDGCNKKHHVFGEGARRKLVEQFGIANSFEIPITPALSQQGDSGTPLVIAEPDGDIAGIYQAIVDAVVREVSKLEYGDQAKPKVSYVKGRGMVVALGDGREHELAPADLRRRCRCALCIDEMSGEQVLKPEDVGEDIFPTQIQTMGNYAIAIHWSDGHTSSIYPYDLLLELTGAKSG
jgi:DUF971 family protein